MSTPSYCQNGEWSQSNQPNPILKTQFSSCVYKGKIFVFGGYSKTRPDQNCRFGSNSVEVYDPITNAWEFNRTPMPSERTNTTIEVLNNKIYIIGGTSGLPAMWRYGSIEVYDPVTDMWRKDPIEMSCKRYGAGSCVINGKLFIFGGYDSNDKALSLVESFDPESGQWETKASMPTARINMTISYLNGQVYAMGGFDGTYVKNTFGLLPLQLIELYDVTENLWSNSPTMLPDGLSSHSALVYNNLIYIAGGSSTAHLDENQETLVSDLIVFNPILNKFIKYSQMPKSGKSLSFLEIQGLMYIVGGQRLTGVLPCEGRYINLNMTFKPNDQLFIARNGNISSCNLENINDSIGVNVSIQNAQIGTTKVYLKLINSQRKAIASLPLFDDGKHYDKFPSDGVYGRWIKNIEEEDIFNVNIISGNYDLKNKFETSSVTRPFTTIGPIVVKKLESGSINLQNDTLSAEINLINKSSKKTAIDIKADFYCEDQNVAILTSQVSFGDILPGHDKVGEEKFILQFPNGEIPTSPIKIYVSIQSSGTSFWFDEILIDLKLHKKNE